LRKLTEEQQRNSEQLSSGDRIASAAVDPSGLAISEKMRSHIKSQYQAERNANDAVSLLQTTESQFDQMSRLAIRLKELAIQSANDTLNNENRMQAQKEFGGLVNEIKKISQVTKYNELKTLNGSAGIIDFQVGAGNVASEDRISLDSKKIESSIKQLGIGGVNVLSKANSQAALAPLDQLVTEIGQRRSEVGSLSNSLSSAINNLQKSNENHSAANSQIRDVDYAQATAKQAQIKIREQANIQSLTLANSNPQSVLKLLG